VVGFYDRWYDNLIPDYTAGLSFSNGKYYYYPDSNKTATSNALTSLYSLMKTGEMGGTTSSNFKSGLNTYVKNAGYSLSYSSFYNTSKSVDIQKLINAIDNNQTCIVMCSTYNFVLSISNYPSESMQKVVKTNSTIAHMMMVYGYITYTYYSDGEAFQSDTFLYVCSSYGSGAKGWMKLNDFLTIDEALIITVS
jgi:hypothetical protein